VFKANFYQLPASAQQRLQEISAIKADRLKIARGYLGGPIWSMIGGGVAALVVYFWVFSHDDVRSMDTTEALWTALFAFLAAGMIMGGLLSLMRRRAAPVRSFWYVHPVYLIDADFDQVTAYPLVGLDSVNLTHHLRNGVYQYTDVAMKFGALPLSVQYFGKDGSVEFAKSLLSYSDRLRLAQQQGTLSSVPESNLFETTSNAAPAKNNRWLIESGAAGAAGAVLGFALLPAIHDTIADDNAFYNCGITNEYDREYRFYTYYSGTYDSKMTEIERTCRYYVENYPDGKHIDEADDKIFSFSKESIIKLEDYKRFLPNGRNIKNIDAAIVELYNQAEKKYRETAKPQVNPGVPQRATPELANQGIEAMAQVIQALRDTRSSKVYVQYSRNIDFEGKTGHLSAEEVKKGHPGLTFTPIEPAFTTQLNQDRESGITQTLVDTFGEIIPQEIMRFEALPEGTPAPADAAVVFDINYLVYPSQYFFSGKDPITGLDSKNVHHDIVFAWSFTIKFPKNPAQKTYELKIESIPANSVNQGIDMYDSLVRSCFADFGAHLKGTFGFEAIFNVISPKDINSGVPSIPPLP
jgi:hypothetical protein